MAKLDPGSTLLGSGCLDLHLVDVHPEDPDRGALPDRALGRASGAAGRHRRGRWHRAATESAAPPSPTCEVAARASPRAARRGALSATCACAHGDRAVTPHAELEAAPRPRDASRAQA